MLRRLPALLCQIAAVVLTALAVGTTADAQTFSSAAAYDVFSPAGGSVDVKVGDVNGDGIDDAVVLGFEAEGGGESPKKVTHVRTVLGRSNEMPLPPVTPAWRSPVPFDVFAAVEATGDKFVDLVVHVGGGRIALFAGNGDGSFGEPDTGPTTVYTPKGTKDGTLVLMLATGDVDGDGDRDVVVPLRDLGTVTVLWNQRDGRFKATETTLKALVMAAGVGDFNNDTRQDLAVLTISKIGNLEEPHRLVVLQDDEFAPGEFAPTQTIDNIPLAWNATAGIGVGDVNGDGIDDAVTTNGQNNSLSIFSGSAAGLTLPQLLGEVDFPSAVTVADFDRDGIADILAANYGALEPVTFVTYYRGGATFGAAVQIPGLAPPDGGTADRNHNVAAGDLNGDGRLDILVHGFDPILGILAQEAVATIAGLAAAVDGLATVPTRSKTVLKATLRAADALVERGQLVLARLVLEAFVVEVRLLRLRGLVSPAEATELIAATREVQASL